MSKKKSFFILITFLVLFACKNENKINKNAQTSFFCNTEKINEESNDLCDTQTNNIIFKGNNLKTDEDAHSGKYSLKLTKEHAFGFSFNFKNHKSNQHYKVSVWIKGNADNVFIVADGANSFYKKTNKIVKTNETGWKFMVLDFFVPPGFIIGDELKTYVWNSGTDTVFADDFKIQKMQVKVTHIYKEKALRIFIEDAELEKLNKIRKIAFQNKVLETTDDSWVKAVIFYGENDYKAKLRFKGDWLDHLQGIKWSFRIKLKKNGAFKGMREFSIQTPAARYFIDEWLTHKIFEKEDILTTRYEFIPVYLNGKNLGLYVYEEHFVKQLVENKKRREGPIIKFSENQLWKARVHKIENTLPAFFSSEIIPFKAGKTISDINLKKQFELAQNLLNKYKFLSNNTSDIFDIDKLAKYLAIVDLTRAYHGLIWHNQRFYYNPIISKLEPIAYDDYCDAGVMQWTKRAIYGNTGIDSLDTEPNGFNNLIYLFRDSSFVNKYIMYLTKFSDEKYISNVLSTYKNEITHYSDILKYEFPDYKYDSSFLISNADAIRKELPSYIKNSKVQLKKTFSKPTFTHNKKYETKYINELVPLYVKAWNNNGEISIVNYYPNKIELLGISTHKKIISNPFTEEKKLSYFQSYKFFTELKDKLYLYFKVEGQTDILNIEVLDYPQPSNFNPSQQLLENSNFKLSPYFKIVNDKVIFSAGKQVVDNHIIIPKGYKVIFEEGVNLDFIKNSMFISYSPVFIKGTKTNKVIFQSSDGTAQGFTVLQANEESIIKYVIFKKFNTLNFKGWTLTGAINFYESDVIIDNTTFEKNYCEDALNIVRSNFKVSNCNFTEIYSDAFDSDFCTGKLSQTNFNKIGNDAIDFSGSTVSIIDCNIDNANDKGISGGENSTLNITNCVVASSNIGFASKDKSVVTLNNCKVENCKYGLVALQKKPEYDYAKIIAKDFIWDNVITLYAIEKKSYLSFNNKKIKGNIKNLAKRFY